MKIRNGFVSNSSSSSFVLIVKKEQYDLVYQNLSEDEKKVIDAVFGSVQVFGIDCMLISECTDRNGNGYPDEYTWSDNNISESLHPEEVLYDFEKKLKALDNSDIFSVSQDW